MVVLLFLLWITLNGKITVEIAVIGIIISVAIKLFSKKYLEEDNGSRISFKNLFKGMIYLGVLLVEIIKSSIQVVKFTLAKDIEIQPQIKFFRVPLKSDFSKMMLANSITLTPGTITVNIEGDVFCVHGIDYTMLEGIENSIFVRLLSDMEGKNDK